MPLRAADLPEPLVFPLLASPAPDVEKPEAGGRVSHVVNPTLTVYLPASAKDAPPAPMIVMISGGGYVQLASAKIGRLAAERFLPQGFAVASLKYRLAPPSDDVVRDALADAKRAVRLVRTHAAEWNVDPAKVGVVGFSAGGNLILHLVRNADPGDPGAADPVERQGCRPDFVGLLSAWPYKQKAADFTPTPGAPPAFIGHARDDGTAPFAFGEALAAEWKSAGLPVEFLAVDKGDHLAFSLSDGLHKDWPDALVPWLRSLGLGPAAR